MLDVSSELRVARRYLTRAVHNDWPKFADLPGPNIRNRTLYTDYGLDAIVVTHRTRRNNFLIKSELSTNKYISQIIGNLKKITI